MSEQVAETGKALQLEHPKVTTLVTTFKVAPNVPEQRVTNCLVNLMFCGAEFPGFWSGEILTPSATEGHDEWKLVQRFRTEEEAQRWMDSEARRAALAEVAKANNGSVEVTAQFSCDQATQGSVAAAIVSYVNPETLKEYCDWERKIQLAQVKYPGYRGAYLQPPSPGREGQWTTLVHFDTPSQLENWFNSDERKQLLLEADSMIKSFNIKRMATSFPGWFCTDKDEPPPWKTAILVFMGLYPLVLLQSHFVMPHLLHLPIGLRFAIVLPCSVSIITWVTMPFLIHCLRWWLWPKPDEQQKASLVGTLLVIALMLGEMAIGTNLAR